MQISLEWLNEYVDINGLTAEQIAHGLTMSGLEVEDIEKTEVKFSNIKTVQIIEIMPHPNADKLHLVKVDDGTSVKCVVCGAQNIEKGQIIPYASVGSKVLDRKTGEQFTLTPAVIRGVESQGMLCSADELGVDELNLQKEDGILILSRLFDNIPLGKDVKEVLNLQEDTVLHVAPTANRGDEMSVIGIAREVATIFSRKLKQTELNLLPPKTPDFKVEILDDSVCKYYAIGILKNLKIGPSPAWMQRRLVASGVRAISNIVDVTNYVMLEYGQPLHAFDLDKLNGYLCVRRANPDEKMTTLDETERKLTNNSVMIATKERSVAMAGVMGGLDSEIDDNTKNVALESAYFPPTTTRRSSQSVGLRSEASGRFERGVDIENCRTALNRAIGLLIELCGAEFEGITQVGKAKLEEQIITLRYAQIKRYLGIEISENDCIKILESLGFELKGKNQLAANYKVPSFRAVDVTREIDLIEEVARIYGYDKIAPTLPDKTIASEQKFEDILTKQIRNILSGKGLNEAVTSSLTGKGLYNWANVSYDESKNIEVLNPQSEDYMMLRQSLIPSLLNVVKHNFDNGTKNVWCYELGKTFFVERPATQKDTGVDEKTVLAGVITGNINTSKLSSINPDFYILKGIVEEVMRTFKLDSRIVYEPCEDVNYLHPKRSAYAKLLGKDMKKVAKFGQLHPVLQDKLKLNQEVYFFEIDFDALLENSSNNIQLYKELPIFPAVTRDIAFLVPKKLTYQELIKSIKKYSSSNLYKGAEIFDIYEGEHIQDGFKSVAFHIVMQDKNATLTEEIVEAEIQKLKSGLKKAYPDIIFRE